VSEVAGIGIIDSDYILLKNQGLINNRIGI
jgi:hypothetical protein